jgi:hypothetical protein
MLDHVWISDHELADTVQQWAASPFANWRCIRRAGSCCASLGAAARLTASRAKRQPKSEQPALTARNNQHHPSDPKLEGVKAGLFRPAGTSPITVNHAQISLCEEGLRVQTTPKASEGSLSAHIDLLPTAALHKTSVEAFRERLMLARDAGAILLMLRQARLRAERRVLFKLKQDILERLLDVDASFNQLIEFLGNRSVDPLGINENDLGTSIRSSLPITKDTTYKALLKRFSVALDQGLLTSTELSRTLPLLPKMALLAFGSWRAARPFLTSSLCLAWKTMKTTSTLSKTPLKIKDTWRIVNLVARTGKGTDIELLVTDVVETVSLPELARLITPISKAFWNSLARESGLGQKPDEESGVEDKPVVWIAKVLNGLPDRYSRNLVRSTTSMLWQFAKRQKMSNVPAKLIYPWIATVESCRSVSRSARPSPEWKAIENVLAVPWSFPRVVPYLRKLETEKLASGFLFEYWACLHMRHKTGGDALLDFEVDSISTLFSRYQLQRDDNLAYFNLVDVFRRECPAQLSNVLKGVIGVLHGLGKRYEIYVICRLLLRSGTPIRPYIFGNALHWVAEYDGQLALRLFRMYSARRPTAFRLEACGRLVRMLIRDPKVSPVEVIDMLLGRSELHFITRRSGGQRRRWQIFSRQPRPSFRGPIAPRLRLIHYMALEFAHAPHLSWRAAFRAVHRCYLLVAYYRQRIGTHITRAMTHAGIILPLRLGEGISKVRLRFILRLVRMVEGREVATRVHTIVVKWARFNEQRRLGMQKSSLRDTTSSTYNADIF